MSPRLLLGVDSLPDPVQPGLPVLVGERLAVRHLGDVRRRVQRVAVGKLPAKTLGQQFTNGRLAGTGHPRHDDRHHVRRIDALPRQGRRRDYRLGNSRTVVKLIVQVDRGADQGQMAEGLREVA